MMRNLLVQVEKLGSIVREKEKALEVIQRQILLVKHSAPTDKRSLFLGAFLPFAPPLFLTQPSSPLRSAEARRNARCRLRLRAGRGARRRARSG